MPKSIKYKPKATKDPNAYRTTRAVGTLQPFTYYQLIHRFLLHFYAYISSHVRCCQVVLVSNRASKRLLRTFH